jgi:hypothetical protein
MAESAKTKITKNIAAKPTKEKVWESKGSAAENSPTPSKATGGSVSSFGSLADSRPENAPGTGAGKSIGMTLKKSDNKDGNLQAVALVQVSKVSAETSKKLTVVIRKLSICNDNISTWKISFEILTSGKIFSPKLIADSGGTESQKLCIANAMAKWNLGSTSTGLTNLTIKFSGK